MFLSKHKTYVYTVGKKGYIGFVQDEYNKRKVLLVVMDKVKSVEQEKQAVTVQFMKKLYGDIPKEELKITLRTLLKMDKNIGGILE